MKQLLVLSSLMLFFTMQIFAQATPNPTTPPPTPAEKAILKADLLLSQRGRTEEAMEAYVNALALSETKDQEVEIGRGLHACAVNFHREAVRLEKEKEPALAKLRHKMAWKAFKSGEAQLMTENISPYVVYTMSVSAIHGGEPTAAIPYLETIKEYETELSSIYHYLYVANLNHSKEDAHKILNEGFAKHPNNQALKKDMEMVFGTVNDDSSRNRERK